MKRTEILATLVLALSLMVCQSELAGAAPMGTAFTYQGRLIDANDAADGLYDFEFKLFDDPCTGIQQGGPIDVNDLDVIDGYFTVELDFGGVFNGNARWLETAVRPGDSNGVHTMLSPRQELTPTPYAIYASASAPDNDWWVFLDYMYSIPLGNVGIGTTRPAYKLDVDGDLRVTGSIIGTATNASNADKLDGYHESSFFQLNQNETVTGRPYLYGGVSGSTPPFYVDSTYIVPNLNADRLDGLHSSSFSSSAHLHDTRYYTEAESDSRFVNVTGDSMTGALDARYNTTLDYAVKGEGQNGPTNGYLGVQGNNSYDGITSTYWANQEIGVAGISTGGTTTDNYGVLGHASQAGVRGEYSGDPNSYGELGRYGGYGVRGEGTSYAGYFLGGTYGVRASGTSYGSYALASQSGTGYAYGAYNKVEHSGTSGITYGTYSRAYSSDSGTTYGTYSYASKVVADTGGNVYGGYFTGDNDDTGNSYGVYGRAIGSDGTNYGVYGYAANGTTNYAGYFSGNVRVNGNLMIYSGSTLVLELGTGLDYAEGFDVSESTKIDAGSVLIIDADNPGKLALSNKAYDTKVAGIVAGANGIGSGVRLGTGEFDHDVALAGRVYCNVDATETCVEAGDLLTTSATPGYAMKSTDYARAQGAILGKAMESLEKGQKGQILVLVTLQ